MPDSKDDRLILDWQEVGLAPQRSRRHQRERGRTRTVVLASVILGLLIAPFGIAATGDVLREGVRNGTTASETEIIGKFNATTGAKGGYVTRQSNTQTGPNAGGGAIYGCRGAAGGTSGGSAPCLRASNLADGLAFEFASKSGPAGLFEVASATDAPFATNGGGVVTNLNADKVDGLDADQLRGQQGPPGPKGDTGDTGPSDGVRNFDDDIVEDVGTATTIKTINLPEGSWIVNATVTADSDAPDRVTALCDLLVGGTKVGETHAVLGAQDNPGEFQSLALTGGDTLSAAGTAELACRGSYATTDFFNPSLTAIQVDTLDTQTG